MKMTTVYNLAGGPEQVFSLPPRDAVIAAYAQARGDWSTWTYSTRYSALVEPTARGFCCGDFAALA
jgi:hypothetical protein